MKINMMIEWEMAWALPVINIIENKLKNGGLVWEWGSGSSTIWLSSMATKLITIEHNKEFYDSFRLPVIRLIEPEYYNVYGDVSDPDSYVTSEDPHKNFKKYCSFIDAEEIGFDVIIIDGRSRPSCIKHARSKINYGGIIVLDDAERSYYHPAINKYLPDAVFYTDENNKSSLIWKFLE